MSNSTDNRGSDHTLPTAELNPLLNPLLSQNMGRWAEVYYTSPPEKRDAAVLELLRDLRGEFSAKEGGKWEQHETSHELPEENSRNAPSGADPVAEVTSRFVTCKACGESNLAEHRFCGGCGVALVEVVVQDSPVQSAPSGSMQEPDSHPANQFASNDLLMPGRSDELSVDDNRGHTDWATGEVPKFIPEYDPVSYRYRIYIEALLAVLIAALVYMGWRGTQVWSRNAHTLPEAAPSAQTRRPTPEPPPKPPKTDAAATTAPAQSHKLTEPVVGGVRRTPATAPSGTSPDEGKVSKAALTGALEEQSARGGAPQKHGSEELALAKHYLNGTQGKGRNSSEAAKWLWQSVSKQNTEATVVLSDLYLRGDGVPKSCDQARLLLYAAARKGAAGAADRLRNLRAFGCE